MKYFSKEYFNELTNIAIKYVMHNYDYNYLAAMHEKNRTVGTKTIIAGSSHAMNGIVESGIEGGVINFSISSQDLYFDFRHIKKAVEEGRQKIEICIINIGYYMMYWDLSYSKVMSYLVPAVYYPLFKDSHHYQIAEEFDMLKDIEYDREMFADMWIREFVDHWAKGVFMEMSSYYGEGLITREDSNILGVEKVNWNALSDAEKRDVAIERTNDHNSLNTYEHTRRENVILVGEMVEYLIQHDIMPAFVIFPFTKYYNAYIDKEYRMDIEKILQDLPYPVEFLDMNDYQEMFDDSDYLDSDHLNLQGALKATSLLNDFLKIVRE